MEPMGRSETLKSAPARNGMLECTIPRQSCWDCGPTHLHVEIRVQALGV